ncbi:LuxR family transcriptional regulator [Acetobacter orientalis]|uniref:LuxR family transcriptional regulator n=1 Tax=Acetobacter orientalis TaxID=146474 RepID=A0A2Z5ZFR4_9PROT|nr:LuxR family transcriptional regulator [Acetobacter orientalis]
MLHASTATERLTACYVIRFDINMPDFSGVDEPPSLAFLMM